MPMHYTDPDSKRFHQVVGLLAFLAFTAVGIGLSTRTEKKPERFTTETHDAVIIIKDATTGKTYTLYNNILLDTTSEENHERTRHTHSAPSLEK